MFAYCRNNPVCRVDITGAEDQISYNDGELLTADDLEQHATGGGGGGSYTYSVNFSQASNSSSFSGGLLSNGYTSFEGSAPVGSSGRFSGDQQALLALAKENQRGVTRAEAELLVEWANEYGINNHPPQMHPDRNGYWSDKVHIKIHKIHIAVID